MLDQRKRRIYNCYLLRATMVPRAYQSSLIAVSSFLDRFLYWSTRLIAEISSLSAAKRIRSSLNRSEDSSLQAATPLSPKFSYPNNTRHRADISVEREEKAHLSASKRLRKINRVTSQNRTCYLPLEGKRPPPLRSLVARSPWKFSLFFQHKFKLSRRSVLSLFLGVLAPPCAKVHIL